jgi:hypothetical protein
VTISKNIKTDYGATGNGKSATAVLSITSGTNALSSTTSIFAAGDVGASITIPHASAGPNPLTTTIASFVDGSHITIAVNATATVTSQSTFLCWGLDDSAAFLNFQTAAIADGNATLLIPAGVYVLPTAGAFFIGISNLTINATGATLSEFGRGGIIFQTSGKTARLVTAPAGSTSVTAITPANALFFAVNDWLFIGSYALQGSSGYPPNLYWGEYHQVTSVNGSTGVIGLDSPLQYRHLSTLPFPAVGGGGYDVGGPATAFVLRQDWNQTVTLNGGTIGGGSQCQIAAKNFTANNVTFLPNDGTAPSMLVNGTFNGCSFNAMEVDKLIDTLTFINCTMGPNQLVVQSSSVKQFTWDGGSISAVNGTTVRNMAFRNCTITNFTIGSIGYGHNETLEITNCTVSNNPTIALGGNYIDLSLVTYSAGAFSMSAASGNISEMWQYGVPGAKGFFTGTGGGSPPNWSNSFTIQDATQDAVNINVITNLPGALPVYSGDGSPVVTRLIAHPARNLIVRNCTGCADIVDLSQAPSFYKPIYSYTKRTYTGNIGAPPFVSLWGRVVAININVTTAYVGSQPSVLMNLFGQFGGNFIDSSNVFIRWNPQIDLKTAGLRTITPGSVTGSGGADSNLAMGAWWIPSGITIVVATDLSAGTTIFPVVTVEGITDQGIPKAAATTLRMLMHA